MISRQRALAAVISAGDRDVRLVELALSVNLSEVTGLSSAGVYALYQVNEQLAVYQRALALVAAAGSTADTRARCGRPAAHRAPVVTGPGTAQEG